MTKTDKPAGTRGVAYIRCSGGKQDKRSQEQGVRDWLAQRGLAVSRWYDDIGSRDTAWKRRDWQEMMASVERGEVDWIVCQAADRMGSSNNQEFGATLWRLSQQDCELWSVTEGCLSRTDPATEILNAVGSLRSQDEQAKRGDRSVAGKVAATRRNEWAGGFPPLAFDLAAVGPDGAEKWRVVYHGQYRRERVWPDGRRDEYAGRSNMPPRDKGDVLKLAVSRDPALAEWVRKIFRWYTTEAISLFALAVRLRQLGAPAGAGAHWNGAKVASVLKNQSYLTGGAVWGRVGQGRFKEYVGGEIVDVPRVKGRASTNRPRPASELVIADPDRHGLRGVIDRETWDLAQAKLAGIRTPGKAPRNPRLWCAALLRCGMCRMRMSAWTMRNNKYNPEGYSCSTYRRESKHNSTGCRLHLVPHALAEEILRRYVEDAGGSLDAVLDCPDPGALRALVAEHYGRVRDYCKTAARMREYVESYLGESTMEIDGQTYDLMDVRREYEGLRGPAEAATLALIAEKKAELSVAVAAFGRLTSPRAQAAGAARLAALEAEIDALEGSLGDLGDELDAVRADLARGRDALRAAKASMAGGSSRRVAEGVGRGVGRVVCHFRHFRHSSGQDRSELESVVVEPLEGAPVVVTLPSGPDFPAAASPSPAK